MKIYHGSNHIITNPEYGKGNHRNDYGLGFYCTENIDLAKEWSAIDDKSIGFANEYELDLSDLNVLDLRKEKNILVWLSILLKYRTFDLIDPISIKAREYLINNYYIDVEQYDVIIGYRADDSYFSFAKDFIKNTITLAQLEKALVLGELGDQVVLKSKKAFKQIKYIGYHPVDSISYFIKRNIKDGVARNRYINKIRNEDIDGVYMIDIIRKGIK